jgi:hypothetical protein
MICSNCGLPGSDGPYCSHCREPLSETLPGVSQSDPQSPAPAAAHDRSSGAYAFSIEVARWSRADMVVGVSTLILFVSLFLPWYSAGGFITVNGLWHAYEYITLIVSILIMGYLIFRAGFTQISPDLRISHDVLLIIVTAINLVVVVIGFVGKPVEQNNIFGITITLGAGAYLALIAAIVAVAGAVAARLPQNSSAR